MILLFPGGSLALSQDTATDPAPAREIAVPPKALAAPKDLPVGFRKDGPVSLDDLKSIEAHIKALAARLSPAVVAVHVGDATGSGVVVSEDGFVLCAAHVCVEPNRKVFFIFPDGRTARGKTLGTNHDMDSGLMKITDSGPWPHVEMGAPDQARLGDWVLALGHPGGFDRQRSMVVRLGRIIRLAPGALQTDCTLTGGDSGGPLFDMNGRVIGIHSSISDSAAANFHVPIGTFLETWERLAKGDDWGDRRPPPRPYVGARGVDHPEGCRLERVEENSPAFKAGLKIGDVVLKVNNQEVKDSDAFRRCVRRAKPGEELTFEIRREDKEISLTVTVEARRGRG